MILHAITDRFIEEQDKLQTSQGHMVGPVGFEPTTSAESLVYGYLHALPNFLIP